MTRTLGRLKVETLRAAYRQGVPAQRALDAYAKWQVGAAPDSCEHEGPGDRGRAVDCQCRGCQERGCIALFEAVYSKAQKGEL